MKNVGETINIKSLETLISEGVFRQDSNGKYISTVANNPWMLLGDEEWLGKNDLTIVKVDSDDPRVPYMVSGNFWIPAFMIDESVSALPASSDSNSESVSSTSSTHVSYGKVFKYIIKLEKDNYNSNRIYDTNKNQISALSEDDLLFIQNMLIEHAGYIVPFDISPDNRAQYLFTFISTLIR